MSDLIAGVDLSDVIARLAIVNRGGEVVTRGIVAPNRAVAIRDAAQEGGGERRRQARRRSRSPCRRPAMSCSDELATALAGAGKAASITTIAAGTAAAIAEQWCGAAVGSKQMIAFSIAEHVTAGVMIDGRPWHGAHGLASSVGWLALNPVEREDYRRYGGLEAEVASAGIVRRFVWRIKSGDRSKVADQVKGDFTKITAADILQGARTATACRSRWSRDTAKIHRHGGRQPGHRCSIRRSSCSAASSPRPATSCWMRFASRPRAACLPQQGRPGAHRAVDAGRRRGRDWRGASRRRTAGA